MSYIILSYILGLLCITFGAISMTYEKNIFAIISICIGFIITLISSIDIHKILKSKKEQKVDNEKPIVFEPVNNDEREVTAEEFKNKVFLEYPKQIEIFDCRKSKRTYDIIGFSDNTELISSYVNNTSVIEEDYDFIFISNEKIYYSKDIDEDGFDSLDSFHPMYFCKDTRDGIKFTMKPVGIQKYTCQFIKIKQSTLPNQTLGMSYIADYDSLVKLGYVRKKSHYTIKDF